MQQVRERAASLPGVTAVTVTDVVPLSGGNRSDTFRAEGRTADEDHCHRDDDERREHDRGDV